jgi:hypothetical protein
MSDSFLLPPLLLFPLLLFLPVAMNILQSHAWFEHLSWSELADGKIQVCPLT